MVLYTTLTDNESLHPKHNKNNMFEKEVKISAQTVGERPDVQMWLCSYVFDQSSVGFLKGLIFIRARKRIF